MSATTVVTRVAFVAALFCLAQSWAHAFPVLSGSSSIDAAASTNAVSTANAGVAIESTSPNHSTAASVAPPRPRATHPVSRLPTTVVIQPRSTGYFVGDLVTQQILLEGRGQSYTPISLPPPGRVNSWFERRRESLVTDDSSRHWLVVEYQFLNAPKAVTAATLPAWQLSVQTTDTTSPITLIIPATSLNIAPLSPPGSPEQVGTRDLRPDHVAPDIDTIPIRHALAISAGGLALTLVAWLAWVLWRNQHAYATQPFAHALRELRTLPDDEPRAWQILHRAFDRTAGRVIQSATLPVLFERAPQFAPARVDIEEFFSQSTRRFFARTRVGVDQGSHANSTVAGVNDILRARAATAANGGSTQATAASATGGDVSPDDAAFGANSGATAANSTTPAIRDRSRVPPAPLALCQALRRIEKLHES